MKLLLKCFFTIIFCSFIASVTQSSFGNVQVESIKINTKNDQHLVFDLYKPKTATKQNKAPFIVVVPGFQRSKEALSNIAIELSRRDMVVALIDPYAQGLSSSSRSRRSATTEGYGMFYLVDYAYSEKFLDYIDINIGDSIIQNRFGKGTVLTTEGIGGDKKAEVKFETSGLKKILLKFAKYQKVG